MKPQSLLFFVVLLITFSPLHAAENIISNPSFEDLEEVGTDVNPTDWIRKGWKWEPTVTLWGVDRTVSHTGNTSIFVDNILENHAYFVQSIKVKENTRYCISGWVRTEKVGTDAEGAGISIINKFELAGDFRGDNPNWQKADLYVVTGKGTKTIEIMLGIGNYGSENTGKAWFDDISMTEVEEIPPDATVTVMDTVPESPPVEAEKKEPKLEKKDEGAIFLYIIIIVVVVIAGFIYFVVARRLEKQARYKDPDEGIKEKDESGRDTPGSGRDTPGSGRDTPGSGRDTPGDIPDRE
ncbi:MAG: hypothetical protein JW881_07210 [Spirochaetales bacterium]|nr:hypothetical protein [Spirochaetales bacterium]